jgi:hypothetical protein
MVWAESYTFSKASIANGGIFNDLNFWYDRNGNSRFSRTVIESYNALPTEELNFQFSQIVQFPHVKLLYVLSR